MLVDYQQFPAVPTGVLVEVTNTLACWLPSDEDASALAHWDERAWAAAEWVVFWQNSVPWLAERIRASQARVPEDTRDRLFTLDRINRSRTALLLDSAVELLRNLRAEGIETIPLKGAALAPLYYPDPLRRPMADLDILVLPQHLARGVAVLRRLGYHFVSRSEEDELYTRGSYPTMPLEPTDIQPVEMHQALREEYAGLTYDLAGLMWRSARLRPYWAGFEASVPGTAALLHHVCAHATSDWLIQRGKLMQINDIRQLAARMSDADWREFSSGVSPYGARFVYAALALAMKYVHIAAPAGVVAPLRAQTPARLRNWVDRTGLADASYSNPGTRSGLGIGMARLLARSSLEYSRMLLRGAFPYRWNLTKRYPRLTASPLWPAGYALISADRAWRFGRKLLDSVQRKVSR